MSKMYPTEVESYDIVDELTTRLLNRQGRYSEDRRSDDHDAGSILGPGPRTGCHGDTAVADVTINNVAVTKDGDSAANIQVTYSGKYTRQGWIKGCTQDPSPGGHEDRNVSGNFTLRVHQNVFKPVDITWGVASNVGDVADLNHDSNLMAIAAVKNAIVGAF